MEFIEKAKEYVRTLESRIEQLEREASEKDALLLQLQSGSGPKEPIEATPENFKKVFEQINVAISKDEVLEAAKAAVESVSSESSQFSADDMTRVRIDAADKAVTKVCDQIWEEHGWKGIDAVKMAQDLVQASRDQASMQLREALLAFIEIEERNVMVAAMGEEEYRRQQQDKTDMQNAMREAQAVLTNPDMSARQKFVQEAQALAQQVISTKLRSAHSPVEMDQIMGTLSPAERQAMFRIQALSQLMGVGGGGGHSHNGQPCHGHGHHAQPASHGHSHDGKPCGGHGHSHGEEEEEYEDDLEDGEYVDDEDDCCDDHGHSHDDHGHSHDDHGHSHDHHGHSHDHHGHSHDHHGHSH